MWEGVESPKVVQHELALPALPLQPLFKGKMLLTAVDRARIDPFTSSPRNREPGNEARGEIL